MVDTSSSSTSFHWRGPDAYLRFSKRGTTMDEFQLHRRGFIASAATLAAAPVTALSALSAKAAPVGVTAAEDATRSFGLIRQIDAGLLNVGYAEVGRPGGMPVILFHGWPYAIHSFIDVAPVLVQAGYRVII